MAGACLVEDLGEVVSRDAKPVFAKPVIGEAIAFDANTSCDTQPSKRKIASVAEDNDVSTVSNPSKIGRIADTKLQDSDVPIAEDVEEVSDTRRPEDAVETEEEEASWSGQLDVTTVHELVDLTKQSTRYKAAYGPILIDNLPKGWMATALLTQQAPRVFGIDCEMVVCADNPSTLARVSLVERLPDGTMKVLLDEYVLPTSAVIEYRSNISGITEEHLASATKLPGDIHDFILSNIARDDVLVGHTLNSDLKALQISHTRIIDTALLFNVVNLPRWTLSLKDLVSELFADSPEAACFQQAGHAHDSVLDATWALRIVAAEGMRLQAGLEPTLALKSVPRRFLSQLQLPMDPQSPFLAEEFRRLLLAGGAASHILSAGEGILNPREFKWEVRGLAKQVEEGGVHATLLKAGLELVTSSGLELATLKLHADHKWAALDFPDAESAAAFFATEALGTAWVDDDGFLCKWVVSPVSAGSALHKGRVRLPDAFADEFVKSYVRLNLDVKLSGHIDKGMVGKVIGKAGRRLREIRRRAGALVRIHKAENGNAKQVLVEISGEDDAAVAAALALVVQVAHGDPLLILGV